MTSNSSLDDESPCRWSKYIFSWVSILSQSFIIGSICLSNSYRIAIWNWKPDWANNTNSTDFSSCIFRRRRTAWSDFGLMLNLPCSKKNLHSDKIIFFWELEWSSFRPKLINSFSQKMDLQLDLKNEVMATMQMEMDSEAKMEKHLIL